MAHLRFSLVSHSIFLSRSLTDPLQGSRNIHDCILHSSTVTVSPTRYWYYGLSLIFLEHFLSIQISSSMFVIELIKVPRSFATVLSLGERERGWTKGRTEKRKEGGKCQMFRVDTMNRDRERGLFRSGRGRREVQRHGADSYLWSALSKAIGALIFLSFCVIYLLRTSNLARLNTATAVLLVQSTFLVAMHDMTNRLTYSFMKYQSVLGIESKQLFESYESFMSSLLSQFWSFFCINYYLVLIKSAAFTHLVS